MVLQARSDSAQREQALTRLYKTYRLPLYGYARRRGYSAEDAEDLVQGFFMYLLGTDFLDRPDPAKGRFRSYLLGALRRYMSKQVERDLAQKRGGGTRRLSWDELDAEREFALIDRPQLEAGDAYEKSWALALLTQALKRLETEQEGAGKAAQFVVLKPFLSANPGPGDYDEAARVLGTTRTRIAVLVHRLNQRYAELVKLEVAATVADPADVKEEMQHLLHALRL